MLPSKFIINYLRLASEIRESRPFAALLSQRLPSIWRDAYIRTITHEPNLARFRHRTFEYICDLYSQLEATGSVPYDQTITDRVIGVFGTSSTAHESRNARRERIALSEELEGTHRDDGHFMARSIGGGLDVNLFSQNRLLNRGWSPQGKIYRRMGEILSRAGRHFLLLATHLCRWIECPALARIRRVEERRIALG